VMTSASATPLPTSSTIPSTIKITSVRLTTSSLLSADRSRPRISFGLATRRNYNVHITVMPRTNSFSQVPDRSLVKAARNSHEARLEPEPLAEATAGGSLSRLTPVVTKITAQGIQSELSAEKGTSISSLRTSRGRTQRLTTPGRVGGLTLLRRTSGRYSS
jgi:hypothetical protein